MSETDISATINDSIDSDDEIHTENQQVSKLPIGAAPQSQISLYVRGPSWMKDRENALKRFKEINPKIKAVRHPRQKSVDFCFIDFASATDRDQAFEELKTHKEITVKPITKDKPKLLKQRIRKVADKREAKIETRKLLKEIKKKGAAKKQMNLTNQIIIPNVPIETTLTELKSQFPSAININLKLIKKKSKLNSAILTFATPSEALAATTKPIVSHSQKLNILLNKNFSIKKQLKKNQKLHAHQHNNKQKNKTNESIVIEKI